MRIHGIHRAKGYKTLSPKGPQIHWDTAYSGVKYPGESRPSNSPMGNPPGAAAHKWGQGSNACATSDALRARCLSWTMFPRC